jgi:signal transduction histidine kinase
MDDSPQKLEQEKLAALVELAYGASHEINNPLANIATRAQLLLRDEPHPERRRMIAAIHAQAMRAHEMIADLMLFARPPQLALGEVDLNRVVEEVARQWQSQADEQATELALSPCEAPVVCRADETQLAVAVGALVRNALEALANGGWVELAVRREGTAQAAPALPLVIEVRDNGPGMSEETRRHAFDPFYSGREAGRGLGFGLSKCWRIVQEHGGEVILDGRLGAGTQVTVRLPERPATVKMGGDTRSQVP